eukprot:GHVS01050973.1.p1 GENE.GHVS01050973.1~~GHVS01050973.1.p1  ORF type:complete len:283 (+),score=81.69 GHVS01050973.1:435-1283(+)
MSLLFFSDLSTKTAQRLSGGVGQREDAAERIDDEILDFYNIEKESTLEMIIKDLILTQEQVELSSTEYITRSQENSNHEHLPTFRNTAQIPPAPSPTSPPSPPPISSPSCNAAILPIASLSPSLCPLLIDIPTGAISSSSVPCSLRPLRTGSSGTGSRRVLTPSPPPHRAPSNRDSGRSPSSFRQRRSRPSDAASVSSTDAASPPSTSSASHTSPSVRAAPTSAHPISSPPDRTAPRRRDWPPRNLIIVQGGGGGGTTEGGEETEDEMGRREGGGSNRGGRN